MKDAIEDQGVPHPEVDLVLVGGRPVEFSHRLRHGDLVSVFPAFVTLDVSTITRVRPPPLAEARFVLDTHLGQLARYLRLLGFDSVYRSHASDLALTELSRDQARTLLTRDVGLLKRRDVVHGYWVRSTDPRRQLLEVVTRFDLVDTLEPFRRCMSCNTELAPVGRDEVVERLPPGTRQRYSEFRACSGCGRVYWKGSHHDQLVRVVEAVRGSAPG